MISSAQNKSSVVASNSFRLSRTITKNLFVSFVGCFGFSIAVSADVISDRKANFRANATSMKAIATAIGSGDYLTVINQAENISTWAQKIPTYFPGGSESGDTKARAEIWINFGDFTRLSEANEASANRLVAAAKANDTGAMMEGLKNLGGSCKACHKLYKD